MGQRGHESQRLREPTVAVLYLLSPSSAVLISLSNYGLENINNNNKQRTFSPEQGAVLHRWPLCDESHCTGRSVLPAPESLSGHLS